MSVYAFIHINVTQYFSDVGAELKVTCYLFEVKDFGAQDDKKKKKKT